MSEETQKITEEELDSLKKISQIYDELVSKFGSLNIQKILIDQQLDQLKGEYSDNQIKERETIQSLNEKYGEGSLNLQTGEFVAHKLNQ